MGKAKAKKTGFFTEVALDIRRHKFKYLIILPILIYLIIFDYKPMYGIIIAFKKYRPALGIGGSKWVGFQHFKNFFRDPYFFRTLRNTLIISLQNLFFAFPLPILFALLLNEVKVKWFKNTVQTISYVPHFISLVVVCGLVKNFCQSNGVINDFVEFFGGERQNLLAQKEYFRSIYLISGVWKELGWNSIIYLAALAGIDQEQYDAAKVDGASRIQQMVHITLPGLFPIMSTLLILKVGNILDVGSQKLILLYSETTYEVADVISTYVYRYGLLGGEYSYSTAVGLFNSAVNIILLQIANRVTKKLGQSGLF